MDERISKRAYTDGKLMGTEYQKALFGEKIFPRNERFIILEMVFADGFDIPYTIKMSQYYEKEFYTAINSLIRKDLVISSKDPKDARKRIYEIKTPELKKALLQFAFMGCMLDLGHGPFPPLDVHVNKYLDLYTTKKELCEHWKEIMTMLKDEIEHGFSPLDIIENEFDSELKLSWKPWLKNTIKKKESD